MKDLVTHLRGLGPDGLARLLAARPDVAARPEPRNLAELAQRLSMVHSVERALPLLDLAGLQLAEALAGLGATATRAELAALLEPAGPFDVALAELVELALVTEDEAGVLRLTDPLAIWGAPLRLGMRLAHLLPLLTVERLRAILGKLEPGLEPPRRKNELVAALNVRLGDVEAVRRTVADAPADVREILRDTAWGGPSVVSDDPLLSYQRGPVAWATERGLLVRVSYDDVQMPAEIALALRGPEYRAPFTARPPEPVSGVVDEAELAPAGSATAGQVLIDVGRLVDYCDRTPPATTKAGPVAVRELRRAAKVLGVPVEMIAELLATAVAAGLLGPDDGVLALTERADAWRDADPAARLATLLAGWWAGGGDPDVLAVRHRMVGYLAGLPDGARVESIDALAAYLVWRHPVALFEPAMITDAWAQAERLGVVALGAATPLARALVAGGAGTLAAASAGLAPAPVETARFGSDLSVIVAGVPTAELAALLDRAAEREAVGTASTWRFSTASVRAGLDAGVDPEGLLADLAEVASGDLPQALRYLVRDVGRRHGQVRVAPAGCVISADDPTLLAEIAATRQLAALRMRVLAPTVLVSAAKPEETLSALRAAGYAPTGESEAGVTQVERRPRRRAFASRPAPAAGNPVVDTEGLASRLLDAAVPEEPAAPEADQLLDRVVARENGELSAAERRVLVDAIVSGAPVRIDYVSGSGQATSRVIENAEMAGDAVVAWCRLRYAERMFVLARIKAVSPAG